MFPILKQLEADHSEEPFGDLDSSSKLHLMRTMCEMLLCGQKYEALKESIDASIEKSVNSIHSHEAQIVKLLKMTQEEVSERRKKSQKVSEFKEVKTST
jgi:hypothetical protein